MAGEEAALRSELARSADERAAQAQQAQLFGQVAGQGGPIQTLGGMQALEAMEGQRLAREATEAGLTGQFRGDLTASERAQQSALESQDLQRRLAEAGVTGEYDFGTQRGRIDTLQSQALASEMQGQALQRALQRAGATGEFLEEGADADAAVETLESRLRTAGLTGALAPPTGVEGEPTATIAGRQADMDLIGAILAAQEIDGADADKMDRLGGALAQSLTAFDPDTRKRIQQALGYNLGPYQHHEDYSTPYAHLYEYDESGNLILRDEKGKNNKGGTGGPVNPN